VGTSGNIPSSLLLSILQRDVFSVSKLVSGSSPDDGKSEILLKLLKFVSCWHWNYRNCLTRVMIFGYSGYSRKS